MGSITFSSPNLDAVVARFAAAAKSVTAALEPATANIAASIQAEIAARYGIVAKYWHVDTTTSEHTTSVHAWGDHPHLIWWEFGTKPHDITPVNARALRFIPRGGGDTVFTRHVSHPGTHAHDQRQSVQNALAYTAAIEWRAALEELLRSL